MSDPLSTVSGQGSVTASLVNSQAQAQVAKTQAPVDTVGTRKSLNTTNGQINSNHGSANNSVRNLRSLNGAASNSSNAINTGEPDKIGENEQSVGADVLSKEQKAVDLKEAASTFRQYLDKLPSDLQFDVDEDTDRLIMRIVNPVTKEVVKQFPPDEFLSMVKRLRSLGENQADNGVFINTRS